MKDVLQIIISGLTYEGQILHIIINYALIILAVMPFLFFDNQGPRKESRAWLVCLAITVIVQVAVWFAARVVGISVVGASLINVHTRGLIFLRNGNVHSSNDWHSILGPVIARYTGYDTPG
jgi:heme A synthase